MERHSLAGLNKVCPLKNLVQDCFVPRHVSVCEIVSDRFYVFWIVQHVHHDALHVLHDARVQHVHNDALLKDYFYLKIISTIYYC